MAIAVTKDGATLSKLITGIRRRTASLQADMHVIAVSCVMHAVEFGNALPATQFVEALTGGSKSSAIRVNALKKWFEEVGCFTWNNGENPGFKMNAARRAMLKSMEEDYLDSAIATLSKVPFWEYVPEPEYKGFDFNARLRSLISQASKAKREHGDDEKTKVDDTLIASIWTLLNRTDGDDDNTDGDDDNTASVPMIEAAVLEASNVDGTYTVN